MISESRCLRLRIAVCLLLSCCLSSLAEAKGHKHHDSPPGPAGGTTGAFDWIPPSNWPAAAQIKGYLDAYLQNCILAPLDSPTPPPRTALSAMSIDFAAHLAAAATPTERALYGNAASACDLLARVLDERDQEQINLINASVGNKAVNPLDRAAYGVSGHYSWNLERERARSQSRQEVQGRLANIDRRNSFVLFTLKHWSDQTGQFRQAIQTAAINVSAAQIRFDREVTAAAHPPAAPVPASPVGAAVDASQPPPVSLPPANVPAPAAAAATPP